MMEMVMIIITAVSAFRGGREGEVQEGAVRGGWDAEKVKVWVDGAEGGGKEIEVTPTSPSLSRGI